MYETGHRWGPVSLALAIAAGLVVGGIALSAAFWLLGILAGFVFAVLKVAVLIGLAALVLWSRNRARTPHTTSAAKPINTATFSTANTKPARIPSSQRAALSAIPPRTSPAAMANARLTGPHR